MSQLKLYFGLVVCLALFANFVACENVEVDVVETDISISPWETDINWLRDTLPQLHYNLFMYESEDSYVDALNNLEANIGFYYDMEIVMELTRILASMNCSHTGISFWAAGSPRIYPLFVMWLESGLYVTSIHSDYSELIGARLIEFDGRPVLEAAEAMAEMFPDINQVSKRTSTENFLPFAHCMQPLGFGNADSLVQFTLVSDFDDTITVELAATQFPKMIMTDLLSSELEEISLPIFLSSFEKYWFRYLPEREMLYCAYTSCSLIEGYDMNAFVEDLDEIVNSELVKHITVDLRRNGGGNSLIANPLIEWLETQASREDIIISLIIGRDTYSSGILNAMQISEIPGVIVYGEETSGAPNHLGEVKSVLLPESRLQVIYPTKYFEMTPGPGTTMVPDVVIPFTPEMLFFGENSVLDAICSGIN